MAKIGSYMGVEVGRGNVFFYIVGAEKLSLEASTGAVTRDGRWLDKKDKFQRPVLIIIVTSHQIPPLVKTAVTDTI